MDINTSLRRLSVAYIRCSKGSKNSPATAPIKKRPRATKVKKINLFSFPENEEMKDDPQNSLNFQK